MQVCIRTRARARSSRYVYMHTYFYACMCECVCVCMYIYVCIYTRVNVCVACLARLGEIEGGKILKERRTGRHRRALCRSSRECYCCCCYYHHPQWRESCRF